jgi:hypothetical protein
VDAAQHPIKTAAGQAELSTRALRLSQRHRTVLFLADGKHSETEVRSMAVRAGVPDTCFDDLVALGLIDAPAGLPVREVDLPLPVHDTLPAALDSVLPASRTLSPESVSADSRFEDRALAEAWPEPADAATAAAANEDPTVTEAREILLRAVRSVAPVAGSLTLLRLRRARTREELAGLLDEVEQRIAKPPRPLAAAQTLRRVRELLEARASAPVPAT